MHYALKSWASLVAQMVKNPLAMQEIRVRPLAWEDTLEKKMDIHSSVPDWETLERGAYRPFSLISVSSLDFLADTTAGSLNPRSLFSVMQSV